MPMSKHFLVSTIALIALLHFSPPARAQARQPGAVYDFDKKDEKPGPAPRHDLSGIWEPAKGPGAVRSPVRAPWPWSHVGATKSSQESSRSSETRL